MQATIYDFLVARLYEWGVRHIFGCPGDGINGTLEALRCVGGKIEFVRVWRGEMAAFVASARTKFTGEPGVCMATSGPDAVHLIAGLYNARLDHIPVLVITGQQARTAVGGHYQRRADLTVMFRDMTGAFVHQASMSTQVRHLLDRAVRIAIGQRRVTALVLPSDLQEISYTGPPRAHGVVHSGVGYSAPSVIPQAADLGHTADVLNSGCRVAMFVGADALGASAEVVAVTETLGADVAKALLGKTVLPDDLPYVVGAIGLLDTEPSWELMNRCDTLLMVGSGFPHAEFLPKEGQAHGVQIDLDPSILGLRYPAEVNLVDDSAQTLHALLPLLRRKTDPYWPDRIARWNESWWKTLEDRVLQPAYSVNPQHVFWELSPELLGDVTVTSDSGTCASWYARDLKFKPSMMGSLSGRLASMGAAMPCTIATKLAHPERPVIALTGDGAMQMSNMAELITVSKYWKRWKSSK